ncbi:PTI1-like tyrosine-protein kinase [Apostasia shenzhenica]|uniref:PTI1-like tyrosine-protein kinase n=1 Tax=Apostasia shenzhenica TaxID=1088818 RepID=A0A2I0A3Y3_9ASPA|nr:PTI1-like tyrosine-protein kinase [Apostasia shenzhenica]
MKIDKYCCVSRKEHEDSSPCPSRSSTTSIPAEQYPWEIFTLKELLRATNNFHIKNKLGEGGFGTVYWGRTAGGGEIAVKRLKLMTEKAEMEFAVEVEVLGRVRHKNLLGLRGYHASGAERLIVYEYMPNRSLLCHLHSRFSGADHRPLDWRRRMRIALESAAGISYLHHEISPRIIHRDIKASNILLDAKFRPKVADFGFAKLVPDGVSHFTTRVKGTFGYLAPEYAMWGRVSSGCDVYSFGILLLELVSGRRPLEKIAGQTREILHWAMPLVERGRWDQLADPRLSGRVDLAQLRSVVITAVRCTEGCPERRPAMREVVEMLLAGIVTRRPAVQKEVVKPERLEGKGEKEKLMSGDDQPSDQYYCIRGNMDMEMMR